MIRINSGEDFGLNDSKSLEDEIVSRPEAPVIGVTEGVKQILNKLYLKLDEDYDTIKTTDPGVAMIQAQRQLIRQLFGLIIELEKGRR